MSAKIYIRIKRDTLTMEGVSSYRNYLACWVEPHDLGVLVTASSMSFPFPGSQNIVVDAENVKVISLSEHYPPLEIDLEDLEPGDVLAGDALASAIIIGAGAAW